jgi:hypothetical protein
MDNTRAIASPSPHALPLVFGSNYYTKHRADDYFLPDGQLATSAVMYLPVAYREHNVSTLAKRNGAYCLPPPDSAALRQATELDKHKQKQAVKISSRSSNF